MKDLTELPAESAEEEFTRWCGRNDGYILEDASYPVCWIGGETSVHFDPVYGSISTQTEIDPQTENSHIVNSVDRFQNPNSIIVDRENLHVKYGDTPVKSIGRDITFS